MGSDHGIQVEWIILADAASLVGGKLYLLGGGWERLIVNEPFPYRHLCAIAVAFRIPWAETNERHQFTVEVQDTDGQALLQGGGHFEAGRPAGIPVGQAQRAQFAITAPLEFKRPGIYVVLAGVDHKEVDRTTFSVELGPSLIMRQLQQGQLPQ